MDDTANLTDPMADREGVEQLGRFWIAGSLEALERRAVRERSGRGPVPLWLEVGLALAIVTAAIGWVSTVI